jgi:hypothetical protein
MVYCMIETNLCPPKPEIWECPTNKGSAAAPPRYSSAVCPTVVRRTSAAGQMVSAFITDTPMRYTPIMKCTPVNCYSASTGRLKGQLCGKAPFRAVTDACAYG